MSMSGVKSNIHRYTSESFRYKDLRVARDWSNECVDGVLEKGKVTHPEEVTMFSRMLPMFGRIGFLGREKRFVEQVGILDIVRSHPTLVDRYGRYIE